MPQAQVHREKLSVQLAEGFWASEELLRASDPMHSRIKWVFSPKVQFEVKEGS